MGLREVVLYTIYFNSLKPAHICTHEAEAEVSPTSACLLIAREDRFAISLYMGLSSIYLGG